MSTILNTARRTAWILFIPSLILGVLVWKNAGTAAQAVPKTYVAAPEEWVPFQAHLQITHPDSAVRVEGRYFRNKDGSTRRETGPSLDDIRIVDIVNALDRARYLYAAGKGWVRLPLPPMNVARPPKWIAGQPNWKLMETKAAVRKGESGNLSAAMGLTVYLVMSQDGTSKLKAPELNLFDIATTRPDGRHERYDQIELVNPSDDLFKPPAGAAVEDKATVNDWPPEPHAH